VASETEYKDLIAFNDRFTGVEAFERAYGAYRRACADDDIAQMLRERPIFLKQLETAKARKEFLTQQSAQIAINQQRLDDDAAVVQHEGLANFVDNQTQIAIADLKTRLRQLHEMAPAKRGDISATLGVFATRIGDIDTAIAWARVEKSKAEQTRRMVVENEGAARRVLGAATSVDLRPAFDEQFAKSTNELIDRFRKLENIELWAIPERQEDIAAATRKLEALQQQISEVQTRYDKVKRLDERRQSVMQGLSAALREFSRPEIRDKLSTDGVRIAVDEPKSQLDVLAGLDAKPLLSRPDYGETLASADETLGKIAQFKADAAKVSELSAGLRSLTGKIDERERHLLDAPTADQLDNLNKSVKGLNATKIPLPPESRHQLEDTSTSLRQLETTVDAVMDQEEKRLLVRTLPNHSGAWQLKFDKDKLTDEERVQALTQAEGTQAKYDVVIVCESRGAELRISAFEPRGTEGKKIPWNVDDTGAPYELSAYKRIRIRIDAKPTFSARFNMQAYGNEGRVDLKEEFENLARSSRFVFGDVFPEDQVEVMTAFPDQFSRLCQLLMQQSPTLPTPSMIRTAPDRRAKTDEEPAQVHASAMAGLQSVSGVKFPNAFAYWSAQACQRGSGWTGGDDFEYFRGWASPLPSCDLLNSECQRELDKHIFAGTVLSPADRKTVVGHRFCPGNVNGGCYNADTGEFHDKGGRHQPGNDLKDDMPREKVETFLKTLPERCPRTIAGYFNGAR
jgi:hypothetical protein